MVMVPSAWGTFWLCSRYLRVESTCQTGNSIPSSRWKHILILRRFGGVSFIKFTRDVKFILLSGAERREVETLEDDLRSMAIGWVLFFDETNRRNNTVSHCKGQCIHSFRNLRK